MAGRPLSPEERAIWARLARSVKPLASETQPQWPSEIDTAPKAQARPAILAKQHPRKETASSMPLPVLDSSWERRITSGNIAPEMTVDLHGHNLEEAHLLLNRSLAAAVAQGARVLLVVTGKPRPMSFMPAGQRARGAIRSEIGDWLALSGHASAIASVRTAHPRHGGKGALYVILRRRS